MRNLTRQLKSFSLMAFALLVVILPTQAQNQGRAIPISTPGYYFVEPDDVMQDSHSAAITLQIDDLPSRTYQSGLQVVFITKVVNGNNANITIQIEKLGTSLGVEKLLSQSGDEFGIGSLDSGAIITATYDGTDFRADFNPRAQFRYIEPDTLLMLTGDDYSIADTSIPTIATEPVLIGIKAEATNTGNVTLSVNGSQAYAVYLSNGDQIPPGALEEGEFIFCAFTTVGGVGFRAINLRPARSLKGRLVATATLPAAAYVANSYAAMGSTDRHNGSIR